MSAGERIRERAIETLQSWTGLTVAPAEEVSSLRENAEYIGPYMDEVEDMAANVLDYIGGRPHEVQASHRRRLAQQSRIALIHDPLAGAEAQLRSNFAFGRGISKPQAKDPEVQKIIDRAWRDPNNERKLTSFEAQRHRSNEMLTAANLFMTMFTANGQVRVGFRDADDVTDVVTDPEDDETPLWYVVRKRKMEWDYSLHQYKPVLGYELENGMERVWYLEHFRNVTDLEEWASKTGAAVPERPDAAHTLPGQIEHFRINRIGRSQFGVPPWARTLRYYTALNQLAESQVQMRQGAASIIAQRIRRGTGPRDLMKNVSGVMARTGELASANFRRSAQGGPPDAVGPGTEPRGAVPPPAAGSWFQGFEHDRLEAVNLRSGAGEALQDAQIVRAPIAASSGFGQHYLGDASSTNLASATTLELPTLMEVSAWQETFEGIYRFFTDRAIEAAVLAGQLGGMLAENETFDERPLQELHLEEDQEEMELRTGRDLNYTFQMPYPGRRNLPDVTAAVATTLLSVDPGGRNWALREAMLDFLFRHGFQTEDPSANVEEIVKEGKRIQKENEAKAQQEAAEYRGEGAVPGVPSTGPAPSETGREKSDGPQYPGQKTRSQPAANEMGAGTKTREVLMEGGTADELSAALIADTQAAWEAGLSDPALFMTGRPDTKGSDASAAPGSPGPLT
jgi:hypothetical protein